MTTMWINNKIIEFVKETLGCACPDEVFEKIEAGKAAIAQFAVGATRIVVGDRLLIYIVSPQSLSELCANIGEAAVMGKNDRDTNKYNRFRLVVISDKDSDSSAEAITRFAEAAGSDEKMHLHFIGTENKDTKHLRCIMTYHDLKKG